MIPKQHVYLMNQQESNDTSIVQFRDEMAMLDCFKQQDNPFVPSRSAWMVMKRLTVLVVSLLQMVRNGHRSNDNFQKWGSESKQRQSVESFWFVF